MTELRETLTSAAEQVSGSVFGAVAAVRAGRAVHTRGCGYAARFQVEPWARAAWPFAQASATVRLSRGAGLPDSVPDVLGIGVRVHTPSEAGERRGGIDLLAASAGGEAVGLRHVLRPGRRFDRCFFSSLMPYQVSGEWRLYGFRLSGTRHLTLGAMSDHSRLPTRLDLVVAPVRGPWERVATLTFADWLDDEVVERLALDPSAGGPFHTGGFVARLREAAYRSSQTARPSTDQHAAVVEGDAALADVRPG